MQGVNIWISDLLSWIKRDGKVMEKTERDILG